MVVDLFKVFLHLYISRLDTTLFLLPAANFDGLWRQVAHSSTGNPLRFEVGGIMWDKKIAPVIGQRLSYDVGQGVDRQPTALNLQTI
jgi:hypothetical protein